MPATDPTTVEVDLEVERADTPRLPNGSEADPSGDENFSYGASVERFERLASKY